MSDSTTETVPQPSDELKAWFADWPIIRQEIHRLIHEHAHRDPSLHFEVTLAELELNGIDETLRRMGALGRLLYRGDITSAELQATGNC
ncbi:MAG: hypothetical protein HC837_02770 [Chloroflexaceae bacterium]|nr:hypothetical protein [Chloroflexaceae bacterium]